MDEIQRLLQKVDEFPLITSQTDAIRVDFLPSDRVKRSGRLGMTIAPGKCNFGMSAVWKRDLEADLVHLREEYSVDILVTLLEAAEMRKLGIPHLQQRVNAHGMQNRWFPIPDFSTPTDLQGLIDLVQYILAAIDQGKTVVVHCRAGLGRTGLVISSCLTALGYTPHEAFTLIRQVRPGSVETPAQEAYVNQFVHAWKERG